MICGHFTLIARVTKVDVIAMSFVCCSLGFSSRFELSPCSYFLGEVIQYRCGVAFVCVPETDRVTKEPIGGSCSTHSDTPEAGLE